MSSPYNTTVPEHWHKRFGHLGDTIYPHEYDLYSNLHPLYEPVNYYTFQRRPSMGPRRRRFEHSVSDEPIITTDHYRVSLDVHHFAPNEVTVKTVGNTIQVEAIHDAREDEHGYVSRQFSRQYILPEGFDAKYVVPELSSDGILTIKAKPDFMMSKDERIIPIQFGGHAEMAGTADNHVESNKKIANNITMKVDPVKQTEEKI